MKISVKKGFTLIELLVVIAIIGILASIVLVSLGGARDRARDARIIADLGQLRTIAERSFVDNGDYNGVCDEADEATLAADAGTQGGTNYNCFDSVSAYCIEVQMNSGNWWCADSSAKSAQYAADPACAVANIACD